MDSRRNILFPVETINRELDYRLLLGALLATSRNRIFIGQHDALARVLPYLEGGLYVGKHIFRQAFPIEPMTRYRAFKERGFLLVHLDEEGAVYTGGQEDWKRWLSRRLDVGRLDSEDHVLTWGDFQRRYFLEQHPKCAAHIQTTGHPRFDLYKEKYRSYFLQDAEALRRRWGPFVLVNTNLSFANNGLGLEQSFSRLWGFDPRDAASRRRTFARYARDARALVSFVELLNELSLEFPELRFVLRPHPSEDQRYYKAMFGGIRNVSVLHEGPVAPWIFASELLLHDGCTTGIESYLADRPTLIYKQVDDPQSDCFLPNQFGETYRTTAELVVAIRERQAWATSKPAARNHALAETLLANLHAEAFPPVVEAVKQAEETVARRASRFDEGRFRAAEQLHQVVWTGRGALRHLFPNRLRKHRLYASMFYGFNEQLLGRKLDTIAMMVGKRPQMKFVNAELFMLEGSD